MKRRLMLISICVGLVGCIEVESVVPDQVRMESKFGPEKIEPLMEVLQGFSNRQSLTVSRGSNEILTVAPDGRPTVYASLLFRDDPVIVISSAVAPDRLRFSAADFGEIPIETFKRMVSELQIELENELDLDFEHKMKPWTKELTSD